ncbi:hypothetical protein SDC9_205066 [bioreactor metagenome]|uniref:Uncharacterized protein n=1 Tax=bioreactor metagenome TaxID=1076179 RepID=A0A645J2P2_9ZZZZ
MFFKPIAVATSLATLTFFPIESIKVNFTSGNKMAKGMPGKPPPVPTSNTVVPGLKFITWAIASECNT